MRKHACSILVFVVALLMGGPASAAEADQAVIRNTVAVVDMQMILRESTPAKSIQRQLEAQQKLYQDQINKDKSVLTDLEGQLLRQRGTLSQSAYEEKRKEFEKKVVDAQRKLQEKKAILENGYARGMEQVQTKALGIVAKIAQDKQLMLVLQRSQTVLSQNALDITKAVTDQLNKDLPSVTVQFVAPTAPKQ